ncbi:SDR family oxidoreductase [Variovorax sp. VaC1]|uniref:SDR family oxidoreductase n=1 Tax=Variovorax sp. VaC1 TaxID=3373132 RepID=UPI0037494535
MKTGDARAGWSLVTGGSEGIGRAIALDLTGNGHSVTILARDTVKLAAAMAAMEARRQAPTQVLQAVSCDIGDHAALEARLHALMDAHGTPTQLFNVAGYARPGFLDELPVEDLDRMMRLNYLGTAYACKIVAPRMVAARRGRIVNTSSMAGFLGIFGYTGYCASKFAVIGFSEALKRELAPFGIEVAVLCPPNTRTPGLERENRFKPAAVLAEEERHTTLTPEAVAAALWAQLARKRFLIVPAADGRRTYHLNRLFPRFMDRLIRRPA